MPFNEVEAQRIVRRFVCARCYGHLIRQFAPGPGRLELVVCPTCGDVEQEGVGRVTAWWAEHKGQEAVSELREVKKNLEDLFPKGPGKPQDELLKNLGF